MLKINELVNQFAQSLSNAYSGDPFKLISAFMILWFFLIIFESVAKLTIAFCLFNNYSFPRINFKKENLYHLAIGLAILIVIMGIGYIQSLTK